MKTISWRSVTGGIAALLTIVGVTAFVLLYARAGALHGSRFTMFVASPDADNLRTGSDVWLNGQRVGVVRAVRFDGPTAPVDRRVVIEVEVLTAVQRRIRIDSRASLQSGGTLIGEPVVYIQAGSRLARRVGPGDTLHAMGNPDLEAASSKAASTLDQVPKLLANGRDITASAKAVTVRLGVIQSSINGGAMWRNTQTLMARVTGGRGSAKMAGDTSLQSGVKRSLAAMDSLHMLLSSNAERVGRFRRDSSLAKSIDDLRGDVAHVRAMAGSTSGMPGRLAADSALHQGLDSALAELTSLLADIKKHPLRYAHVF